MEVVSEAERHSKMARYWM